jgi:hypothetical protein
MTVDGASGIQVYSDKANPLTIVGWPIVSAGAVWIETDRGLWTSQNGGRLALASSFSGYIAGGCL